MDSTFVVFAGPNGSGKSTLVRSYLQAHPDFLYVCADDLAKTVFKEIADLDVRARISTQKAEEIIRNAIQQRTYCGYETVLSSDYKWEIFDLAKQADMKFVCYFIGTNDPQINCRRIRKRVDRGSHDVPEAKVVSRYYRSLERLPRLLSYSDLCLVYDNSNEISDSTKDKPALCMVKVNDQVYYSGAINPQHWLWSPLQCLRMMSGIKRISACLDVELMKFE